MDSLKEATLAEPVPTLRLTKATRAIEAGTRDARKEESRSSKASFPETFHSQSRLCKICQTHISNQQTRNHQSRDRTA